MSPTVASASGRAGPHGKFVTGLAAAILGSGLPFSAVALETGTSCPTLHGRAPLMALDGSSVFDGDPARHFLLSPDRQGTGARGAWKNSYSFAKGASITVVCNYRDGFRHAFVLAPTVRACTQDADSFECR